MVYSFKKTQWLRIAVSAIAVVLLSFLAITVITFDYAFVLAIEVRGRPDQAAISHFASAISRWLMPLLEMFFTFFVAMFVSKKIENNSSLHGLFNHLLLSHGYWTWILRRLYWSKIFQ
jgi:Zn-dependent protease with chaperone function